MRNGLHRVSSLRPRSYRGFGSARPRPRLRGRLASAVSLRAGGRALYGEPGSGNRFRPPPSPPPIVRDCDCPRRNKASAYTGAPSIRGQLLKKDAANELLPWILVA